MGSTVRIGKGLLEQIVTRAVSSADEVCGLLVGAPDRVTGAIHCRNVAADPATTFEIEPAQLIAAYRAARRGGPAIVGCYHSHPSGPSTPSARDAADAAPDGWLWLIVDGSKAGLFRAIADGPIHGRFQQLSLLVVPAQGGPLSHP